ncbi:hypothetical protein ASZ78_004684 [Callipepla squamata]|uniref:IQ domain-containing protein E n=1 Tax=Callipepla squamata TaxID=9009 RepID=A0A226NIT9_CALSU|nr:hypothetical protein ASZ78_004684 [Callipepla squamata]
MARGSGRGDDSLSVITCESDAELKLKKKIFHKPPKSPRMSHSLKSDVDMGHMRAGISSSTPEYLKEALGMKKPKHSRSSSNGYIPGTPDYKEKEDMYDEIMELKKTIQAQKNEGNLMKTKLRRLEEENNRKDKQIEQLLDPSRGSELARALSAKKADNGWVVNGLKQKICKLEQQCKEKDNTINKFQSDMKTTNLEEMRIAMETYCEEVHRLQILLAKSETMKKKYVKSFEANICVSDYSEWSRQRLMRRILDLEKKVGDMENSRVSSADSESSQLLGVSSAPSADPNHPAPQQVDHIEECRRLRGLVKKLRSDRSALQSLLLSKESDIRQLLQAKAEAELELQKYQNNKEESTKEEQTLSHSEEVKNLTQKVEKLQEEEERQMTEDALEKLNEAVVVLQAAFRGHLARQKLLLSSGMDDAKSYNRHSLGRKGLLHEKPLVLTAMVMRVT